MIGLLTALSVLCIGDSLTANNSYCTQSLHTTYNIAEGNTTTAWWLDPAVHAMRIIPALAENPVDVVSIMLSSNDIASGVDPAQIETNLRALVALLESEGAGIIAISIPPRFQDEANVPIYVIYNGVLDEVARRIYDIAADTSNVVRFGVDWRLLDLPYPDVWWDRVHPTAAGHALAVPFVDAALIRASTPVPALGPVGIAVLLATLGASAYWRLRESGPLALAPQ